MQNQINKTADKLIGTKIYNRYHILEKIASGGMADVYLGNDSRLNRKIAVKILHETYAGNKSFVARFKREAQILARLNNPNIVMVYDWGEFDSLYFIIMEYVSGISLKEIIEKRGSLNPKLAAKYSIQICNALDIAHSNNLIHRDIKSQNIMITEEGSVKVADFGIAKTIAYDLTKTISILGTAHYISPEQAQGRLLDYRTDIYSLGIVMYEMLTADLPFRGGSSIDISLRHVSEIPQLPSKITSDIPTGIEKIIMKCLEKNPARRYQTVTELKEDLQNFIENKPLTIDKVQVNNTSKNKLLQSYLNLDWQERSYEKFYTRSKILANTLISISSFTTALFIIFLVLFLILNSNFNELKLQSNFITVPPLEKVGVSEAKEILTTLNLNLIVKKSEYNDNIAKNYITQQQPQANTKVKSNSNVEVIISKGKELILASIPNLIGLSLDKATLSIEQMGFKVGNITEEFNDIYENSIVIDQNPKFNENIDIGSSVNLTVSKGKQPITIPDLTGYDYISCKASLESLGLQVEIKKVSVTDKQPGTVMDMIPSAGSIVNEKDKVILLISTTEQLISVPNLISLSLGQAQELLSSLSIGYEVSYIKVYYSVQKDSIIAQYPESSEQISQNDLITLFVGQ